MSDGVNSGLGAAAGRLADGATDIIVKERKKKRRGEEEKADTRVRELVSMEVEVVVERKKSGDERSGEVNAGVGRGDVERRYDGHHRVGGRRCRCVDAVSAGESTGDDGLLCSQRCSRFGQRVTRRAVGTTETETRWADTARYYRLPTATPPLSSHRPSTKVTASPAPLPPSRLPRCLPTPVDYRRVQLLYFSIAQVHGPNKVGHFTELSSAVSRSPSARHR